MSDLFQDFVRKSWPVQSVQVTLLNIQEVAEACGGEIRHDGEKEGNFSRDYIKVPVRNQNDKYGDEAHVGDWIVKQGRSFKVYPDSAFRQQYELKGGGAVPGAPAKKPYKGKNKQKPKGPTPAQMPRKKPVEQLVEDTKTSSQELPTSTEVLEETGAIPVQAAAIEELNQDFTPPPGTVPQEIIDRRNLINTKIEEGKLPLSEPKESVPTENLGGLEMTPPPELARLNEKNLKQHADSIDANEAEIQANVDAQLAQSPVEAQSMGAFVNGDPADHTVEDEVATPKPKPITLEELNAMPGDDRTAADIYREARGETAS